MHLGQKWSLVALFEILCFRKEKLGEKIYENYIIDCQNFVYKQTMSNQPLKHTCYAKYMLKHFRVLFNYLEMDCTHFRVIYGVHEFTPGF